MSLEPRAHVYRRRRRASQNAHRLPLEEMLRPESDHDLELETSEQEQEPEQEQGEELKEGEDEEEEDDEEEEEEEEEEEDEDEEEELAPESSMEEEEKDFERHRREWEGAFGRRHTFDVITSLSPMVYTHCTPSCVAEEADLPASLQICSIKIAKIKHLDWPLHVYGTVAARDHVDQKRNILFYRSRRQTQTITKDDPYLHLTGPSRGILSVDHVHIELQLMVKQGPSPTKLVTRAFRYRNYYNSNSFYSYLTNHLCKIELCFEQLERSRQATVLAVRAMQGSSFKYGGQVTCCASSPYEEEDPCRRIVLFDSKRGGKTSMDSVDGTMSMDPDGYLDLSRHVVSVQGRLKIFVNTYSRSGAILASGRVSFRAMDCQISQAKCVLHYRNASKGNTASKSKEQVKINVAWSRFARQISDIERGCYI